jgi:hypothetical protein
MYRPLGIHLEQVKRHLAGGYESAYVEPEFLFSVVVVVYSCFGVCSLLSYLLISAYERRVLLALSGASFCCPTRRVGSIIPLTDQVE